MQALSSWCKALVSPFTALRAIDHRGKHAGRWLQMLIAQQCCGTSMWLGCVLVACSPVHPLCYVLLLLQETAADAEAALEVCQ